MTIVISTKNLVPNATMAHVMWKLDVFTSVTQARKNGWDYPIVLGKHTLTKKKILVEIVDHEIDVPEASIRWDLLPGFWNEYTPPSSAVAWAIQYPHDHNFADRMVAAYMRDVRAIREEMRKEHAKD